MDSAAGRLGGSLKGPWALIAWALQWLKGQPDPELKGVPVTGKDPSASVWYAAQVVADRAPGSIPREQFGDWNEPQAPVHTRARAGELACMQGKDDGA